MKKIISYLIILMIMIILSVFFANMNIFLLLLVMLLSIMLLILVVYEYMEKIKKKIHKLIEISLKIISQYINKYSILLGILILVFFVFDIVNLLEISFFSQLNKDFWLKLVISVFIYLATVGFFEQIKVEKESKIQMAYSKVLNVRLLNLINYVLEASEIDNKEISNLENLILEIVEKFYKVNLNETMEILFLCKSFYTMNSDKIELTNNHKKLNEHKEKIQMEIELSNLEDPELNELIKKKNIETKFDISKKKYINRLKVQDSLSRGMMFEKEATTLLKELYHNIISGYELSFGTEKIFLDSYVEDKKIAFEYKMYVIKARLQLNPRLLDLSKDGIKIVYVISGLQNVINIRMLKELEENNLLVIDYVELTKLINEDKNKAMYILENEVGYYEENTTRIK